MSLSAQQSLSSKVETLDLTHPHPTVKQKKPSSLKIVSPTPETSLLAVDTLSKSEPAKTPAAPPITSKIEVLTKQIEKYESLKKIAHTAKIAGLFIALGGAIAAVAFFGAPVVVPLLAGAVVAALIALAFFKKKIGSGNNRYAFVAGFTLAGAGTLSCGVTGAFASKPIFDAVTTPIIATIGGIVCGAITGIGGLIAGAGALAENHYAKKVANLKGELKSESGL